ncbi:MAG TPA: hypothetical protein VF235_00885 [Actinomycetota bacterium]
MDPQDIRYGGLHTFVFIDEVDPGTNIREVIDALRAFGPPSDGPVLFAAEMVGSYLGFAHLRTETLAELQDLIAGELWARGAHCKHCVEADYAKTDLLLRGAKRDTPEIIALIRVRVRRGALAHVLETFGASDGPLQTFKGASVVFGDFDILLQLGGEDFDAIADDIYGPLQEIEGIAATDTAFTDARRYD